MKKTKKLLTFLVAFALIICFTYVDAATYSSYKRGDKINVKLNDTTTGEFYVLVDSDATSNTVTAVYETTLGTPVVYGATANGFDGSTVETTLKALTSTWNAKDINVRLLTAEEIKSGINYSKDTNENFTEPSFLISQNNYWLGDVAKDSEKSYPGIVNYWVTFSTITVAPEDTTTAYIKPVITVSKEAVEGGVVEDKFDYTAEWNKYVEIFKNNQYLDWLKEMILDEKTTFEITHTDNTLSATIKDDNESFTTNFTYKDGIISNVEIKDLNESLFFSEMMIFNAESALIEYKGFDSETFDEWLTNTEGLTLEKDGVELVEETVKEEGEGYSSTFTYAKSFKADLTHDFATYQEYVKNRPSQDNSTEDKTEEKNPTTGILNYGTIALVSVLVAGSIYVVVRKKNKLPHA